MKRLTNSPACHAGLNCKFCLLRSWRSALTWHFERKEQRGASLRPRQVFRQRLLRAAPTSCISCLCLSTGYAGVLSWCHVLGICDAEFVMAVLLSRFHERASPSLPCRFYLHINSFLSIFPNFPSFPYPFSLFSINFSLFLPISPKIYFPHLLF